MQRDKRGRFVKKASTGAPLSLNAGAPNSFTNSSKPIRYNWKNGVLVDETGKVLSKTDVLSNKYKFDKTLVFETPNVNGSPITEIESTATTSASTTEPSGGRKIFDEQSTKPFENPVNFDRTKLANFMELTRAGIAAGVNNNITKRALESEKPFLQDISESHRSVFGDYRSQVQGERAAAQLRHLASQPLTSDGALQQKMMLEAQMKGQEYIEQGNVKDDAMIRQTREVAWQQEKENQQQRQATAMQNKQAVLMSQKNRAQIQNMNDSANYSQVVAPLLGGIEQRIRTEGKEQEYYQDYYDDVLVESNVWNNYQQNNTLSPSQKLLAQTYLTGGLEALNKYIGTDSTKEADWLALKRIMDNEVIRKKAALKGVTVNPQSIQTTKYSLWETPSLNYKKGGTIYKARLTKRIKDNDRGARSIESSKKIAARFLEKAIDSLYDYTDVELIAKPKRKRKYQAGGGLPFVGFSPVFATSEKGTPSSSKQVEKEKEKGEDLTTKDLLTLLKDLDGLPADMNLIYHSLKDFKMQNSRDPLKLSSSSDIASRYISLVHKIKLAKFQREEYNNAFNQLKGNGGLNELAVTSDGLFIGTNAQDDFEYFTPDQVNNGVPQQNGYSLLTNSNLLYMRANAPTAAFQHKLTTVAQNGIGMEVITKHINDVISSLGTTKESEEGFVQMGNKGQVKAGLSFLQKAAKAVNDAGITDNMSIADYYQAGYLTEDQAQQAQLALQYLWNALPANAKSLLQVKGGSPKGAEALLQSIVFAKTSNEIQFKATPKKMAKIGSGSKSSGNDALKLTPVQMMQVGYTDHMPVTLQKGTKYATVVNAQVLPITDVNKKTLGITTLDKVAESTFAGALDMNNVTMGSQLIDPHAMQNVQIDSTNLYVMNLPIDKNSPDGTIRPDLAWMTKIEEIDKVIRDQGITDINMINKLYQEAGLPVLMDSNGQLNTKDYCKFGVLNGHALNSAFKNLDLLDNTMLEIDDEDQINNVLSILNNGRSEKDRIDFDSKSWADSIFGTDHDTLYEGTIYIPVRTNAFMGMIGGGAYPDIDEAAEVEALIQQKKRTRGYVDPGLLN